jgi:putative endonuclease
MTREHRYFVYLLTNWNDKVMYVGMTNDLQRRVHEHKSQAVKGFTEKYNVHKLVYFQETPDVHAAIAREKQIKKWRREKKNALVTQANPTWRDLAPDIGLPSVISTDAPGISTDPPVISTEGRDLRQGSAPDTLQQDFSQAPSRCSGQGSK